MEKFNLSIEYCPTCGYLPRAVRLAESLLNEFKGKIEELTLKESSSRGLLEVQLNGIPVHSTIQTRRLPVDHVVLKRVHELIEDSE